MAKTFTNWSDFYRHINLVFNAIIAVSLLPFGWVYLEIESAGMGSSILVDDQILYFNSISLILILVFLGDRSNPTAEVSLLELILAKT